MAQVNEGLAKVMEALNYIPKQRSQGVSYEFRSVDAVFNELHSKLAAEGIHLSPTVLNDWQVNLIPGTPDSRGNQRMQAQALFRIQLDAVAADGSRETLGIGLAQSHDYGDKAVYQAQQNAVKYILIEAFAIPTSEPDMDARPADDVTQVTETVAEAAWRRLWEEAKVLKAWSDDERMTQIQSAMKYLKIEEVSDQDKADSIFAHVTAEYAKRPMDEQGALPVAD